MVLGIEDDFLVQYRDEAIRELRTNFQSAFSFLEHINRYLSFQYSQQKS